MTIHNYRKLVFTGLILFVLHFSAIIVSLSGYSVPIPIVDKIIKAYVYPVFYQNWKVFAPEPPVWKEKMFYKYKSGPEWSEWIDPGEALLQKHYRYRISYHATLFTVYKNIASDLLYLHKEVSKEAVTAGLSGEARQFYINEQITKSRVYKTAGKYCTDKALASTAASIDSIQFSYVYIFPPSFSERASQVFRQEVIVFPPYKPECTTKSGQTNHFMKIENI